MGTRGQTFLDPLSPSESWWIFGLRGETGKEEKER